MSMRVAFNFEPSKYNYMKVRIYRADFIDGSIWAFVYNGRLYLSDTLDTARQIIKRLRVDNKDLSERGEKIMAALDPQYQPVLLEGYE